MRGEEKNQTHAPHSALSTQHSALSTIFYANRRINQTARPKNNKVGNIALTNGLS